MKYTVLGSAVAGILCSIAVPAQAQVVMTDKGRVQGQTADGVESWKGIPYARAPIGALRWQAPQPMASWRDTFKATSYGHDCMQLPFPSDAAPLGTAPAEDCLKINLWRPAGVRAGAKLPVIVWVHGGGFVNGGSSPPTYAGAALARKGVLFISFNYRLGRFGTFAHPALSRAGGRGTPAGNYGTMDQLAALRWVHRNAAAFGGDTGNVTLMGESAGGMSVHNLLTSPAIDAGLVHRAVIMSGGDATASSPVGPADVEQAGIAFARSKGIAADDPAAPEKLRSLPGDQVVDGLNLATIFRGASGPLNFPKPFADGSVVADVASAYAAGRFARVPVMIGFTSGDIGGPGGPMIAGGKRTADMLFRSRTPVWLYRFSYVAGPGGGDKGAQHASEIPFFFDTVEAKYGAAATGRDRKVADIVSRYIVNFARHGNPNGQGAAPWPAYDGTEGREMDFSAQGEAVVAPPGIAR